MKSVARRLVAGGLVLAIVFVVLCTAQVPSARADGEAVFEMREVSVFESTRSRHLVRGQSARCETEPNEDVRAYPKLKSKRPLYGVVKFARDYMKPDTGVEYHFVIDESGGTQPAEEPSLLQTLSEAMSGSDSKKAKPTHNTYDRLYFDLNRDLDLTNDPVLKTAKSPPPAAIPTWEAKQKVVFEDLPLKLDFGAELGLREFPVLPRLVISEYEGTDYASLHFIAKTAREGRISIGSRKYDAVMGQRYLISGRLDRRSTTLLLAPAGSRNEREWWWGADELGAMREVNGKYYTASTTPLGDKLIVKEYAGDFGVLEMGAGNRDIEKFKVQGSLRSADTAVAVGRRTGEYGEYEAVQQCRLPVGDYVAALMSFEFGDLRISVSHNYHSDGIPRDMDRKRVYSIKIRKDRPCVLDFSNKPEVMFASPANDQTFKPDDEIEVKAVLTDPELDIMIRDLDDTTRTREETTELANGRKQTYTRQLSLDPIVTITNSAGKVVSEGKMPFG